MKTEIKLLKEKGIYSIIINGDWVAQSVCDKLIKHKLNDILDNFDTSGVSYIVIGSFR
jgi:hypothetical protein